MKWFAGARLLLSGVVRRTGFALGREGVGPLPKVEQGLEGRYRIYRCIERSSKEGWMDGTAVCGRTFASLVRGCREGGEVWRWGARSRVRRGGGVSVIEVRRGGGWW